MLKKILVADNARRPLYHLQAEDLGSIAYSVRHELDNVFDLATEWNAIVLLNGLQLRPSLSDVR